MAPSIQWNCLKLSLIEVTLLVETLLPIGFCLQESNFKNRSDNVTLRNYSVYTTYVNEDERVAILVRYNILHSCANLNTDLQAVVKRISLNKAITLCSVYYGSELG